MLSKFSRKMNPLPACLRQVYACFFDAFSRRHQSSSAEAGEQPALCLATAPLTATASLQPNDPYCEHAYLDFAALSHRRSRKERIMFRYPETCR